MTAYYNEFDPFAAAWLRELIKDGLIAPGEVDTRSICDVAPADLAGFTQVHLFAGIGGWSHALRLAGWPDGRPVWSGSCPCQPFSAAGKQRGTDDERHLWPEFRRLVAECRPPTVFGEQVASRLGREWLAGVRADLEALGYGVGAADLCAAGVGAPHIRQRLYWTAERLEHAESNGREQRWPESSGRRSTERRSDGRLADANGGFTGHRGLQPGGEHGQFAQDGLPGDGMADAERDTGDAGRLADEHGEGAGAASTGPRSEPGRCGVFSGMGDTDDARSQGRREHVGEHTDQRSTWASSILIPCADGKFRRVPADEAGEPEPTLFPLAHGISNRVGTLRGAGNAIVPALAAEFIRAVI